jgi:hypothetical protein
MPFLDQQLLAAVEVSSGQFFEGTPRPISDVMGLDPDSEMAISYDTEQEFNRPKKDLHLSGIHRDLFETQLFHALK